jgi:restriction endonuclease Mrr
MSATSVANPVERGREILKRGLSALHEALADYILMNPQARLSDMGSYFGYSPSWLSTVTNSDMFKAYFAKRRGEVSTYIAQDLPKKLELAAHLATEKLIETIPTLTDPEQIVDTFDKVLHRAGYAPNTRSQGPAIGQQNNVFYLSKEDLKQAQGRLIDAHSGQPALPAPEVNREEKAIGPEQVSTA